MIVVVASAIIKKGNKFLLVRETKSIAAGKWGLPGGKLEEGESIVDCVRREVKEETGHEVISQKIVHVINKPITHENNSVVKFVFLCTIQSSPTSSAEHKYEFISIAEIKELESRDLIRGNEIRQLLEDNLNNSTADNFLLVI